MEDDVRRLSVEKEKLAKEKQEISDMNQTLQGDVDRLSREVHTSTNPLTG